jgi:threonine/homoserine/homoserine lactone efflux protein
VPEYFVIGIGFAFAAAIQPGPLQAFLLSSVLQKGWKRTLPASFSPLISDGPIALLALFVLNRIPEVMSRALRAAGGAFLIYLAWASYRRWKLRIAAGPESNRPAPSTLIQAVTVNILNPNPYLGWSLVMGPAVLKAWRENPLNSVALIITFYAIMIASLATTIFLFGATRFLGARRQRTLILVSAFVLAVLGAYQIMAGLLKAGAR